MTDHAVHANNAVRHMLRLEEQKDALTLAAEKQHEKEGHGKIFWLPRGITTDMFGLEPFMGTAATYWPIDRESEMPMLVRVKATTRKRGWLRKWEQHGFIICPK